VRICPLAGLAGILVLATSVAAAQPASDGALRHVLAPTGLHLRERPDPGSPVLGTLAYGTTVTLLDDASDRRVTVDGLSGGMARVDAGGVTGYMFDGYLSRYPAPARPMPLERYVALARARVGADLRPHHERHEYDLDGYLRVEEGITIFQADWQEAFVLARALADIPAGIRLPPSSGDSRTVANREKPEWLWIDQLEVQRDEAGNLASLRYTARGEGGGRYVVIERGEGGRGLRILIGGIGD
jgi:hypothetical protein